jgi:hypothetical protein
MPQILRNGEGVRIVGQKRGPMAILPLNQGGTGSDLSTTGGSNQIVKQTASGANLSVAAITTADIASVGIVKNPTAAQIITGQALTLTKTAPLTVAQMENVQYVDSTLSRGGVDIGDEINKAYAALPSSGGTIIIAAGTYSFHTPITFTTSGKLVSLCGSPSGAANLIFTGAGTSSATAITLDYTPAGGGGWVTGHGLRDFNLYYNSTTLTVGGPNKAVEITAWSIASNVATFTINPTSQAGLGAGDVLTLAGFQFGGSTFFNNQTVTVLSSGLLSTQFKANFTHANGSGTEFGFAYQSVVSNTGVKFGPTNSGAQNGTVSNVLVGGFQTNIEFSNPSVGSSSWGTVFNQVSPVNGTFGYRWPDNGNFENLHIQSGLIAENALGIYMGFTAGIDLFIDGVSFDAHTVTGLSAPFGGTLKLSKCHFENNGVSGVSGTHFINAFPSSISITDSFILNDDGVTTTDWFVRANGGPAQLTVLGTHIFSSGSASAIFKVEAGVTATIAVSLGTGTGASTVYSGAGSVNQIMPLAITTTLKKGTNAGNYSSGSTTFTSVDGTNLSYTATIPMGWKLLVDVAGNLGQNTAVVANGVSVALFDGSTQLCSVSNTTQAPGDANPFAMTWAITGDGASHTITLKYLTANAADAVLIYNSSSIFPVMRFLLTPSN